MTVKRRLMLIAVVVLAVALGACGSKAPSLDNTEWRLIRWPVSNVEPTQYNITVKFAGGQVSGFSGVNTYAGKYQAGPGEKFLAIPAAITLNSGADAAVGAEGAYLSRLSRAAKYRIDGNNLVLYDPTGVESLVFERIQ